jgi:hypothetical protein
VASLSRVGRCDQSVAGEERHRTLFCRATTNCQPRYCQVARGPPGTSSALGVTVGRLYRSMGVELQRRQRELTPGERIVTVHGRGKEGGQMVASGRHADLVAAAGPYAQLIAAQKHHV